MECPRCSEDNLPGLPACMGCGLDLGAPPPEPPALVPTVRATNPLVRKARPTPTSAKPQRTWPSQLVFLAPYLRATLWGIVPGLGALARGDRRKGLQLLGGLLGCALLYLMLWRVRVQGVVLIGALSLVLTSIIQEQRARVPARTRSNEVPGVLLAIAAMLMVWVCGALAFDAWAPMIGLAQGPNLDAGQFLLRDTPMNELRRGQLVAVEAGMFNRNNLRVAPIIALPGQAVESNGRGRVLVDGAPPGVPPLRGGNPPAWVVEAVPDGHVVLLDYSLAPVPVHNLTGVLYYRWLPQASRGPIDWPPPPSTGSPLE